MNERKVVLSSHSSFQLGSNCREGTYKISVKIFLIPCLNIAETLTQVHKSCSTDMISFCCFPVEPNETHMSHQVSASHELCPASSLRKHDIILLHHITRYSTRKKKKTTNLYVTDTEKSGYSYSNHNQATSLLIQA